MPRVRVDKADGSSYFGELVREESDCKVILPEDGSCLEKRAYARDRVTVVDGAPEKRKYQLPESKMNKYTKMIEEM